MLTKLPPIVNPDRKCWRGAIVDDAESAVSKRPLMFKKSPALHHTSGLSLLGQQGALVAT